MAKKKVLLTGGSGSMGSEAFKELLRRQNKYDIVLLLLPQKAIRKAFSKYENREGIKIVWGDVCDRGAVSEAVAGVDRVLHVAALVSPAADHQPTLCRKVNYDGTRNILSALKARPDGIAGASLVYIGSVAIYGDRLPPAHMLRVGDPLRPSIGDVYATTKIDSEREIIESDMRRWAILRQTYIAIPKTMALMDPIMYHQPLDTHIELITSQDAGYGVVQTLEAPDDFYGRVYNMSGGPSCRVVYLDYLERVMRIVGMGEVRKIFDRNWFALRNFHCGWYADSHVLNAYLGHQRNTLEDHYRQIQENLPAGLKMGAKLAPGFIAKAYVKRLVDPLKWMKNGDEEKVKAFLGSREVWAKIPRWGPEPYPKMGNGTFHPPQTSPLELPKSLEGMHALAKGRGGACQSADYAGERARLRWRCGLGHEWDASPTLVRVGHWCPQCSPPPWNYDEVARADPAIAIYHYLNHTTDECQKVACLYLED